MKKIGLFLGTLLAVSAVHAELFRVQNIPMEATADTAVQAKEAALSAANGQAFQTLLKKIAVVEDGEALPVLTPDDIMPLVKDMQISDEKTGATKYTGNLSVRFDKEGVTTLLKNLNIPFVVDEPPALLVIPVWQEGETIVSLEESNPLFVALKESVSDNALVSLKGPTGDVAELALMTPDVLSGENLFLAAGLLPTYKAGSVLWVKVDKNDRLMHVETKVYPASDSINGDLNFTVSSGSNNIPEIAKKLLQKIEKDIDTQTKQLQWEQLQNPTELEVIVPVSSVTEWAPLKKKLEKIKTIDSVQLSSAKKGQLILIIKSTQSEEAVIKALSRQNLILAQEAFGTWYLTSAIKEN